jgi:hypothetical protein
LGEGNGGIILRGLHHHLIGGLEGVYTTDELAELGDLKDEIVGELYDDEREGRKVDPGHKFLQILAGPVEGKKGEGRESSTLQRRWNYAAWSGGKSGRVEVDLEPPELRQGGQAGDEVVRRKIIGTRDVA